MDGGPDESQSPSLFTDAEEAKLSPDVPPISISQTRYGCVHAPSATSIRSTRIGLEFLMYHAGIQGLLRPVFGVLLHVDYFLHYSFVASHGSEGTRCLSTCIDLWGRFLSCCERSCFAEPVEYSGCHIELRDTCDLRLVNTAVAA